MGTHKVFYPNWLKMKIVHEARTNYRNEPPAPRLETFFKKAFKGPSSHFLESKMKEAVIIKLSKIAFRGQKTTEAALAQAQQIPFQML
jgi:hypothetical protein